MTETAKTLWTELHSSKMNPVTWKEKSNKAKEYFYHYMLRDFPKFLLADRHWKLEQFATIRYPDWTASIKDDKPDSSSKRPLDED
ncbi:hypothetical protein DXG01_000541 [Tephrocybe rancida]|nr:hypothetical protein DXG01_000541 [Tephrocybe rancida]